MKTSNLIDAIGRLERATHRLREAWIETRKAWDDSVADDFEHRHLDPLLPQLRLTMAAVHELTAAFDKATVACHDPEQID